MAATVGASGWIQVVNAFTGILLARLLFATGRGEIAAAMLWPAVIASVGSLSVGQAVEFYSAKQPDRVGTVVGTSAIIAGLQSVTLVAVGLIALPTVLRGYSDETLRAGLLLLILIPLNLFGLNLAATLNGLRRYRAFNLVRLFAATGNAVTLGTVAWLGHLSTWSAAISYAVAGTATLVLTLVLVSRIPGLKVRPSTMVAAQLIRFGVQSHVSNLASLFNERLDQLLISVTLGPAKLGLYAVSLTLSSLAPLIGVSVAMVALPVIASSGRNQRTAHVGHYLRVYGVGALVCSVPMLIAAPLLMSLFFGPAYGEAVDVARLLLVAAVALGAVRLLGNILKALGRPLHAGVGELLALLVTVFGLLVLLPLLGLIGAALVSLAAYTASAMLMLLLLRRTLSERKAQRSRYGLSL